MDQARQPIIKSMEKYRNSGGGAAQQRGFTLTELLVTMAILVILVAIGAPQMQTFLIQRSVASQAETFAEAVRLTRSEAIKRGVRVTICTSADPAASTPTCSSQGNTADWGRGWVIFVDDGANVGDFDAGETIIRVEQAFNSSGGIKTTDGQPRISFTPNGMALGFNGSFKVAPHMTGAEATADINNRCVVLSNAGRLQILKQVCASS